MSWAGFQTSLTLRADAIPAVSAFQRHAGPLVIVIGNSRGEQLTQQKTLRAFELYLISCATIAPTCGILYSESRVGIVTNFIERKSVGLFIDRPVQPARSISHLPIALHPLEFGLEFPLYTAPLTRTAFNHV
jgi:hypothetical protein